MAVMAPAAPIEFDDQVETAQADPLNDEDKLKARYALAFTTVHISLKMHTCIWRNIMNGEQHPLGMALPIWQLTGARVRVRRLSPHAGQPSTALR